MVKIGRLKRTDVVRIGKGKVRTEREMMGKGKQRNGDEATGRWIDRICEGQDLIGIEKAEI